MKKKLLLLLISLCVVIGGYFLFQQYENKQLVKEAQKKAEEFIYRNYEDIESVHMIKNQYNFIPMGVLSVKGYVNDDENLDFYVRFILEDNSIGKVTSVTKAAEFPSKKEECQNKFCE